MEAYSRKGVRMRARVLMGAGGVRGVTSVLGVVAMMFGAWTSAAQAQQSNSPLYQPTPMVMPPSWPGWQGVQDGGPPLYIPAPRYPTDSRNLALDNRAPSLRSVTPDPRESTLRLGSPLEDGDSGMGVRRSQGLRAPGAAEPGRPSWR